MNETTCLSELMERGIQKMDELGLTQCESEVVKFDKISGDPIGCCALGAILLGSGLEFSPSTEVETETALTWISEDCPTIADEILYPGKESMLQIGEVIYRMNDGYGLANSITTPQPLSFILDWLKSQGL